MAQVSESVIPSGRGAHDASTTGTSAQTTLLLTVSQAILTACASGAFTCTASVSGATSNNLSYLLENLNAAGYTTSISSTTLTVNW